MKYFKNMLCTLLTVSKFYCRMKSYKIGVNSGKPDRANNIYRAVDALYDKNTTDVLFKKTREKYYEASF